MPKAKPKILGTVEGTYCPLDGSMHLPAMEWKGQIWVFCPNRAENPDEAHTAYPINEYRPVRWEVERVPIIETGREPAPENVPSSEEIING